MTRREQIARMYVRSDAVASQADAAATLGELAIRYAHLGRVGGARRLARAAAQEARRAIRMALGDEVAS